MNSSSGFLEQVADYLYRVYGETLHRCCIVFPNIRAGLFFKKYLAQMSSKPIWAPAFRSMTSLMEEITGLTKADNLSMIFDLFKAYQEHHPNNENFEEFYFWGEMLLEDFDDVDKHLVDARDLFHNVSDLKELDLLFDYLTNEQKNAIRIFWQDFNNGNSGLFKTNFTTIWPLLYPIYESFKTRLKKKSLGYEGMIQREAISLIRQGNAKNDSYEKYIFIGFNALTACETYFLKSLQKQERAIFFWDVDDYYLVNHWHEAGTFIRDNIRNFPSEYPIYSKNLTDASKQIEIISVPSETGQAKMVGQMLQQISEDVDWSRIAIVLPDEHLLLPMLSSIPEVIKDVNITMGYPFTYSPVNSLFERLVSLQQHARVSADETKFYHHDVTMILYHPYIQDIAAEEVNKTAKSIIEHNRVYVPTSEIPDHQLLRFIFTKCTQAVEFVDYLSAITLEIVGILKEKDETEQNGDPEKDHIEISHHLAYQLEYLYTFYTALQRIRDILATDNITMDITIFCRLLRKIFASLKIPFNGEPLKGLQVMGVLETRALDFDRVIVLSMNEGIYPVASPKQSFIPYNLRKGFGLTTSERHDAISAYHFYRLIQRASNVHLIYNAAVTDRNTGEMSRFLSQLVYEPVFNVPQKNITFHIGLSNDQKIIKKRTPGVKQVLETYFSEGDQAKRLSPSALNSYLDCRLRFYFRYVDRLKESEQVIDEIDQSVFGQLLHKTMEELYRPYIRQEMNVDILTRIQKNKSNILRAILQAFAEHYFHSKHVSEDEITGRNIIIKEVLLRYILRILEVDKTAVPFTILSLEEELKVKIPIPVNGNKVMVNMGGYIDRLEDYHNSLRIIDYKTGNAQRNFTSIADLFDRNKRGNHAAMQTLVYARMVHTAYPQHTHICSGLYVMKDLFKEDYDPRIYISRKPPINNYFDVAEEFDASLDQLLSEIFLSDTPFTQTEDTNQCLICPYAEICHRKHR